MTDANPVLPAALSCGGHRLELMTPADTDAVFAHFGDPAVAEFLDGPVFTDRSQAEEVVAWAQGLHADGRGARWVLRAADGAFLGTCGFHGRSRSRAWIGYDLARASWGQGIMSRVVRDVVRLGHDEFGLHRIEACVTPGNLRSAALLAKLGFTREGLLRDYGEWCGAFHDQELWARLATDAGLDVG